MDVTALMQKKVIISIVVLIVAIAVIGAAAMGSFTKKPEKKSKPKVEILSGSMPEQSGWFNYDEQPKSFNITANGTALVEMKIYVDIDDWDSDHSDTDEGSDPDTIQVDVKSADGAWSMSYKITTDKTSGHGNLTITIPNENMTLSEDEKLPTEWIITISPVQLGGGKNPTGPFGMVPIPFLQYIDQGFRYSIKADYKYEVEE